MTLNATSLGVRRRNRFFLCMCSRNCIFIIVIIIIIIVFVVSVVMFQNRQVIVTSLGCCWYSGGTTQSPDCWSSCNVRGKTGAGGMEDDSGIATEHVCEDGMRNLGGELVLMLMGAGILFVEVVVVAVGVMVVAVVGVTLSF